MRLKERQNPVNVLTGYLSDAQFGPSGAKKCYVIIFHSYEVVIVSTRRERSPFLSSAIAAGAGTRLLAAVIVLGGLWLTVAWATALP